jgi:hypothetical protein
MDGCFSSDDLYSQTIGRLYKRIVRTPFIVWTQIRRTGTEPPGLDHKDLALYVTQVVLE